MIQARCRVFRRLLITLLPLALCAAARGQVTRMQVDAIAGEPFGVGRVTLLFAPRSATAEALRFGLEASDDRVLYPAYDAAPVRGLVRNLLNLAPRRATAYFLFSGNEPFELRVYVPKGFKQMVRPRAGAAAHRQLLATWWRNYQTRARIFDSDEDFPPQVETYLVTMLSRRLDLPVREEFPELLEELLGQPQLDDALGPLLGTEALRMRVQRETMLGRYAAEGAADLAVPSLPAPPPLLVPKPADEVQIEPLAAHVPVECFYLRSGSFANFQWLRDTVRDAGGDLRNLLAVRGVDYGLNGRLERQLALKESVLARLLGPLVISDVALLGTDTFLREGAAMGVLFEARNAALLTRSIDDLRQQALEEHDGAQMETLEVGGHEVSFLHTPDNHLRSFYAVDGKYHLVTTSRRIVERFYEAGAGNGALAGAAEFRHARSTLPLAREDTAFLYLSSEFFENLLTPQYRIEMIRRLRAVGQIELWRLAQLAARNEGRPAETLQQLVDGGYLPAGFGNLPDGSRLTVTEAGAVDSLRGARGTFLPVPDVPLEAITSREAEAYRKFIVYFRDNWGRMDPVALGIKRHLLDGGERQRVELELRVTPFTHEPWWTRFLGPADGKRLRPVLGDLVSAELNLGDQHLFAGLRDVNPLPSPWLPGADFPKSETGYALRYLLASPAEYLMGYLGGTKVDGPLQGWVRGERFGGPDNEGIQRGELLYRRDFGTYVAFSFHYDILAQVGPLLIFQDAERPAQGRLHVGDLSRTNVATLLDNLGALRARRTTEGNERLLDSLVQQLGVPPDDARQEAEAILDAELVCALGGEYQLDRDAGRRGRWRSTKHRPPAGRPAYEFPPLAWFRGLDLDFALLGDTLAAHATLDMQLEPEQQPKGPAEDLPPPE